VVQGGRSPHYTAGAILRQRGRQGLSSFFRGPGGKRGRSGEGKIGSEALRLPASAPTGVRLLDRPPPDIPPKSPSWTGGSDAWPIGCLWDPESAKRPLPPGFLGRFGSYVTPDRDSDPHHGPGCPSGGRGFRPSSSVHGSMGPLYGLTPPFSSEKAPSPPAKAPSPPAKAPSPPAKAPSAPEKAPSAPGEAPAAPAKAPSAPGEAHIALRRNPQLPLPRRPSSRPYKELSELTFPFAVIRGQPSVLGKVRGCRTDHASWPCRSGEETTGGRNLLHTSTGLLRLPLGEGLAGKTRFRFGCLPARLGNIFPG
jgi:hypothetical protein